MSAQSLLQSDVVVIGGGHAGAEAAWAASNLLVSDWLDSGGRRGRVALVTLNPATIGAMSCNPAIGGLAKGQMVREIDALGGLMALAADATGIQFRVLNASKGPAVQGPRCQSDKYAYAREVQRLLATRPNLQILIGSAERLLVEEGRSAGVVIQTPDGQVQPLKAGAVILTTGTFMRGLMHTGESRTSGGRVGESATVGISRELERLGFELGRLKTGTPPRLDARTIDLASLELQPGDERPRPFSEFSDARLPLGEIWQPPIEQRPCWITHTCESVHELIRANLDRAPMYNGQIETTGPRYCPSIEDKVVRFADRTSHHVFLEPESLETEEIYCNGISTSLPADVQQRIVAALPGCEKATILRYGYAVEYDMVWPHQIDATCQAKRLPGLFLAGQINGTSGYEEAAGQGLIAGLNAVRQLRGEEAVRLHRDQAYLGVMMDDLVTKTPREPYRMFTSRAEHRLLLRADNAPQRLTPLGRQWGLVEDDRWQLFETRRTARTALQQALESRMGAAALRSWLTRPERTALDVLAQVEGVTELAPEARRERTAAGLLADVLYSGYIQRHLQQFERLREQENRPLPPDYDYAALPGLRREAALTLARFQPATLGQAGRLAGVNPADLMVISIALSRRQAAE